MKFQIAAISYISLSEIQKVKPWITWDFIQENQKEFEEMLYDLGLDTKNYPYEVQNVQHRNRFNEIVSCERFVGNERTDRDWIQSGNASQEALDKAAGNKLLADLYVKRGQFEE